MPTAGALSARLEAAVDAQYGEDIELLPYRKTAYMTEPEPDPTRQIKQAVAVVVGRGTFLRAAGNASFISQRASADLLLSIQDKYWTPGIVQHDKVRLLDRPAMPLCEISYIEIGMNNRSVLHLLRGKP